MASENDVLLKYDGEDDTLGNLLRTYLLEDSDVIFAAYKVPHPLTRSVEVRVQSASIPITDLLQSTVDKIVQDIDAFEKAFSDMFS